jgi:hypothetical protein
MFTANGDLTEKILVYASGNVKKNQINVKD